MKLILLVLVFSTSIYGNVSQTKCFQNYKHSFNKKLTYNLYGDLNDSNTPILDLYEKQVMEAVTFDLNSGNKDIFYPKLIEKARDSFSLSDKKLQAMIIEGIESGKFCEEKLFNPKEVMEYINAQIEPTSEVNAKLEYDAINPAIK